MKKQIIAVAIVAMLCLTACGESEKTEKKDDVKEKPVSVQTAPAAIRATEPTTNDDVKATVPADVIPTNQPPTTEATTTKELNIDFNNRSLVIQGKKLTVGETTLQEIIDDGFTFIDEINPDDELKLSITTAIKMSNGSLAMCDFIIPNYETVPMKESVLKSIRVLKGDKGIPSDVELPVPEDVKLDDIIEKYGEPNYYDDISNYANYHSDDDEYAILIYFRDNDNTIFNGVEIIWNKKMSNN